MNEQLIRAKYSFSWEFWFVDWGILRLKLISPLSFVFSAVLAAIVSLSVFFVIVDLQPNSGLANLSGIGVGLAFGVAFGIAFVRPELVRRRFRGLSIDDVEERFHSSFIPWDNVTEARLRNGIVEIEANGKRLRGFVQDSDSGALAHLLGEKVGNRLSLD